MWSSLLAAAVGLTPILATAQPSYTLTLSDRTANGVRVTIDLENTQAGSAPFLLGINEIALTLTGASTCFVSGPCSWGPKSVSSVGTVGLMPFTSLVTGDTWTARQGDWSLDFAGGSTLGWGWRFGSSLGIIGCVDPRLVSEFEWGFTRFYSARTCDTEGLTGVMRFSTFVTVNDQFGNGLSASQLTASSFGVAFGTRQVALIAPEPSTYALTVAGLSAIAFADRRRRVRRPSGRSPSHLPDQRTSEMP